MLELIITPVRRNLKASAAPLTIDFSRPLTRGELAMLAVLANPDLEAARAETGVPMRQEFTAGSLPDPQLGLGFDKRLSGPDP